MATGEPIAVFADSAGIAGQAPSTLYEQPYVVAALLDARHALPDVEIVQRLTAPLVVLEDQVGSLRDEYERLAALRPWFHSLATHAVRQAGAIHPNVSVTSRVKTPRSVVAKALLGLADGSTKPITDLLGARVETVGVGPAELVQTMHELSGLPDTLPGGIPTRHATGSAHSVMYNRGQVGHKLTVPVHGIGAAAVLGEVLAYDARDIRHYNDTRDVYEAKRRWALELRITTEAVKALEKYYQRTVDRW